MTAEETTQEALKKLESQLKCILPQYQGICEEPKLLPCFHAFCKQYLEKLVSNDGHSLICPTCEHRVELSVDGVAGLQSDSHISRLLKIKKDYDKAATANEEFCEKCNKSKAAEYCTACDKLFCAECSKMVHEKAGSHLLQTLDQFKTQATIAVCNATKHLENPSKAHKNACDELFALREQLQKKSKLAEASLFDFNQRSKKISKQMESLKKNIHEEFDELQKLVEEQRKDRLAKLEELNRKQVQELGLQQQQVEKTQAKLSGCIEYAKSLQQMGTKGEVLEMKDSVEKRTQVLVEFNPDSLMPKTGAGLELVLHGKQELLQAVLEYVKVIDLFRFQQPSRMMTGLTKPKGIAVNSKGQIIAIHQNGTEVNAFESDLKGEKLYPIGSEGQFKHAYGVTVDIHDNIYIVDNRKHCLLKFTPQGANGRQVGDYGSKNLQFNEPCGITYNHKDDLLYVVDQKNNRIQVLTTDFAFQKTIGESENFDHPHDVAFDSDHNIYVTDSGNNRVQVFKANANGHVQLIRTISEKSGGKKLQEPWAIAIDSSNIVYISEKGSQCISIFTSQGAYITSFKHGIAARSLTIDNNDTLIVSDYEEGCLLFY